MIRPERCLTLPTTRLSDRKRGVRGHQSLGRQIDLTERNWRLTSMCSCHASRNGLRKGQSCDGIKLVLLKHMKSPGRNDPCWCGSGQKYKKCHLNRANQAAPTIMEILTAERDALDLKLCLAKKLDSKPCGGLISEAHSVSRRTSLAKIAVNGHVYGYEPSDADLAKGKLERSLKRMGVGKASTFTGFCNMHDTELFRPIDAFPLEPTAEQMALLGFRSLSREFLGALRMIRMIRPLRQADRGKPEFWQKSFQPRLDDQWLSNLRKQRLEIDHNRWASLISARQYDRLSYLLVKFPPQADLVCSGVFRPGIGFRDELLLDLAPTESNPSNVAFGLFPAEGFAFFAWIDNFVEAEKFVKSFLAEPEDRKSSQLIRFTFETFDNVYVSPSWWDGLEHAKREFLLYRMAECNQPFLESEPPSLIDNGMEFVGWAIGQPEQRFL